VRDAYPYGDRFIATWLRQLLAALKTGEWQVKVKRACDERRQLNYTPC